MPTAPRLGPYRFFFYAGDGGEPPHVHVERDDLVAEFWLVPLRLDRSGGFSRTELGRVEALVREQRTARLEAWHGYFGD